MDPITVIIIGLSAQLLCSGVLYHLLGRALPARSGLHYASAGAAMFGLACLTRLVVGLESEQTWTPALDVLMVLAALMVIAALREFTGRQAPPWYALLAAVIAYGLIQAVAMLYQGTLGRLVLLDLTLGVLFAAVAAQALLTRGGQGAALQRPLAALALVTGLLALLTLARGAQVAWNGAPLRSTGLPAQVFYGGVSIVMVLLSLISVWMVFVRLNRQLAELSSRDALTRVFNRNGLDDLLTRHFSAREPVPVTLLQVDIDHFKGVNDKFGHAIGDAVLRAVAETLAARVRGNDFVARIGGEEFIVGCVGGDMGVALSLGKRLREGVSALRIPAADGFSQVSCTVSVGVSRSFRTLSDWEQAAREADRALNAAKTEGRNRVVAFEQVSL
jgi:diguanylate cyclase (GGDEF)-like protein